MGPKIGHIDFNILNGAQLLTEKKIGAQLRDEAGTSLALEGAWKHAQKTTEKILNGEGQVSGNGHVRSVGSCLLDPNIFIPLSLMSWH